MPTYEYHCEANGRTIEVVHKMAERIGTWGELCERAALSHGDTPLNAPVQKLMSAGFVNTAGATASAPRPCEMGAPCSGGLCDAS